MTFFTTIGATLVQNNPQMHIPYVRPNVNQDLNKFTIEEIGLDELLVLIKGIRVHKSSGIDDISSLVLKDVLLVLADQILFMMNL